MRPDPATATAAKRYRQRRTAPPSCLVPVLPPCCKRNHRRSACASLPQRLRRLLLATLLLIAWPAVVVSEEPPASEPALVDLLRAKAQALTNDAGDYDRLLTAIGDAQVVMLGEATHGSAEFYEQRARLTRRLIAEKGFSALVLEAGWAPTTQLNAFIQDRAGRADATTALRAFRRFPRWVWRNRQFAAFLDELKAVNEDSAAGSPVVSLYGMDLYGVPEAVAEVVHYLARRDPRAAAAARRDYRCFAPYSRIAVDPQLYGRDVARGTMPSCEKLVRARLQQMQELTAQDADAAGFAALMSARAIAGAEAYYRTLYMVGALESWNLRERFLAESLQLLLERHGKIVVWAHNTHQGDARATDQATLGELSIGQLLREQLAPTSVYLVGMTTFRGSVRAASGWGTPDRVRRLLPAIDGSWSRLLHDAGLPASVLLIRDDAELTRQLDHSRLDRGVGVTYLPAAERDNHYAHSSLARRFDAVIHIDTTSALQPLP